MNVSTQERQLKSKYEEELEKLKKEEEEKKNEDKETNEETETKPDSENKNSENKASKLAKKGDMLFSKQAYGQEPNPPNPNPENDSIVKCVENLKEAKVCNFYLLEFDTDTEKYKKDDKSEYINNPDVEELYTSFSCFFSHEECYRALKMNGDDVSAAAAWLIEDGNQDCRNTLISQRKVLLAQSEVINDKINNRNEHDIQVKDDSILFPYDIIDLYWTLNDGQLALNKYFRNEVDTKIFSIYEEDEKQIHSEQEKEEVKRKERAKKKPKSKNKMFYKRKESEQGVFSSSDEDIEVKSPSLKRSTIENTNGDRPPTGNYETALKMFEKIKLRGSYLKAVKDVKLLDYDMTLSYDHTYNKFYGLVSSQNNKVVLVAQDMNQMRKSTFTKEEDMENIIKEFEDMEKEMREKTEGLSKYNLHSLVNKALEFFMNFERIRFDMPWRWRRWSTVFSSANEVSIIKDNKVSKRLDKILECQLSQYAMKFGIESKNSSAKNKKVKKPKPVQSSFSSFSYSSHLNSSNLTPSSSSKDNDKFIEVPVRIEERKLHAFCVSGDKESLQKLYTFLELSFKNYSEYIQNSEEEKEDKGSNKIEARGILITLLEELAYWIRTSDTLISSVIEGDPKLLDKVGEFLIKILKTDLPNPNENIISRLCWVNLINGFELFFRSTSSQFKFIQILLNDSFKFQKLNKPRMRNSISQYNYYLDSLNWTLPPMQLFFLLHFKYPQTFLFRSPLVCSEIKEYNVKFKVKDDKAFKEFNKPYVNKFMQKQQQLFQLINNGGIIEHNLSEVMEEYKQIEDQKENNIVHLETITEVQTCNNVNQKEFSSPFSMFFLLDQKISFTDDEKSDKEESKEEKKEEEIKEEEDKEVEEEKEQKSKEDKSKSKEESEEFEQIEDYVVDLYLNLYQNLSKDEILEKLGYIEEKYQEDPKITARNKRRTNRRLTKEEQKKDKEEKKKMVEEKKQIAERNQKNKRELLRNFQEEERAIHQQRVQELWKNFTDILLDQLTLARKYGNFDNSADGEDGREVHNSLSSIRYLWKIFNRLVEDSLSIKSISFHNTEKNKEFMYT